MGSSVPTQPGEGAAGEPGRPDRTGNSPVLVVVTIAMAITAIGMLVIAIIVGGRVLGGTFEFRSGPGEPQETSSGLPVLSETGHRADAIPELDRSSVGWYEIEGQRLEPAQIGLVARASYRQ